MQGRALLTLIRELQTASRRLQLTIRELKMPIRELQMTIRQLQTAIRELKITIRRVTMTVRDLKTTIRRLRMAIVHRRMTGFRHRITCFRLSLGQCLSGCVSHLNLGSFCFGAFRVGGRAFHFAFDAVEFVIKFIDLHVQPGFAPCLLVAFSYLMTRRDTGLQVKFSSFLAFR